jgi:hypothetical protein
LFEKIAAGFSESLPMLIELALVDEAIVVYQDDVKVVSRSRHASEYVYHPL